MPTIKKTLLVAICLFSLFSFSLGQEGSETMPSWQKWWYDYRQNWFDSLSKEVRLDYWQRYYGFMRGSGQQSQLEPKSRTRAFFRTRNYFEWFNSLPREKRSEYERGLYERDRLHAKEDSIFAKEYQNKRDEINQRLRDSREQNPEKFDEMVDRGKLKIKIKNILDKDYPPLVANQINQQRAVIILKLGERGVGVDELEKILKDLKEITAGVVIPSTEDKNVQKNLGDWLSGYIPNDKERATFKNIKEVLTYRWGLEDGVMHTQLDTAEKFSIKPQRVDQIEKKFIGMMLTEQSYSPVLPKLAEEELRKYRERTTERKYFRNPVDILER